MAAVSGPARHSRVSMSVSMSLMQGGTQSAPQGAILAAAAPYYQTPAIPTDVQPDRPIGYGAFGVVWAVTDPRDGRRVALKKLPNVFQSLVSSKRVFRELKMLCFFKHENVLSALDILQPPSLDFFQEIYVITELLQSDLHKIIVSPQHLSADHIKVFLYQILRGLKYLHSARILHRDIKPGNLLVNSNCVLKICDFGLARVEEPDASKNMTQEVVTQYYRAPEILMGANHYTAAVDVWSVGCIFGELLGRRILFQAQSPVQQLELITELLGTPSLEDMRRARPRSPRSTRCPCRPRTRPCTCWRRCSCSTRRSASRWWTPWRTRTWRRGGCATTRACASAATARRPPRATTRPTSSPPRRTPSTTAGSASSPPCTRSKRKSISS